jgi:2-keto-4-pentenoate hydratase/2-oxohepta-3-ene-1,7-dioic acid hydratase in catechol pathway
VPSCSGDPLGSSTRADGCLQFFPEAFRATLRAMTAPDRLVRYVVDGVAHHGLERADHLARLDAPPWRGGRATGARDDPAAARLSPCTPGKIVCIGLNYIEHVKESLTVARTAAGPAPPAEPLFFLKPTSSMLAPGAAIVKPRGLTRLDPEGEMALVIGRRGRHVSESEALAHVAGVTAFNDVSARDWQKSDSQWSRAKGSDTFAPFGPCIALGLDPRDLALELAVNGGVRQRARTSEMHFGPAFLVHYVSRFMTLEPGDVIATGTPAGIAPIEPGDTVTVTVEGVGTLVNPVVAESA